MRKYYFYILMLILLNSLKITAQNDKKAEKKCEQLKLKTQQLIYEYNIYDKGQDYERLDSAITLIDSLTKTKCGKFDRNIYLRRLGIFSMKQEYAKGVEYAELLNDSLVSSSYKYIIVNRFKAMEAESKGNIVLKQEFVKNIIIKLQGLLPKSEVDSVYQLNSANDIIKYKNFVYLFGLYYYQAQLNGLHSVYAKLDILEQKWNNQYIKDMLDPKQGGDFMIFMGF